MIQTKQYTNKPKMINRTTYLEGEWKCVKPMNKDEDEKPNEKEEACYMNREDHKPPRSGRQ